jgi:hypothetical protein
MIRPISQFSSRNTNGLRLALLVSFLLLQFLLRTHDITRQDAFVDEGYHTERASLVWHFKVNPGQFANGKILVYYWLGLFHGERNTALYTSRTAIALFSLLTAATIYWIGTEIAGGFVGILALALYTVLPFAFFYERLALADPFASAFACLLVWRSIVFGKRPSRRDGVWIGVLLGLATLAKLTLVLLPVIPLVASIVYFPKLAGGLISQARYWFTHYFPPLLTAALITGLIWLPILIPAYLVRKTHEPFVLVNAINIAQPGVGPSSAEDYFRAAIEGISDFLGPSHWITILAMPLCLIVGLWNRRIFNGITMLLYWLAALTLTVVGFAAGADTRYLAPTAAPFVLIIALAVYILWQHSHLKIAWRGLTVIVLTAWLASFAVPFITTAYSEPSLLPLHTSNHDLFFSGGGNADFRLREVAATLNKVDTPDSKVYANWVMCYLMYFYASRNVHCLQPIGIPTAINMALRETPATTRYIYVVVAGYDRFRREIAGACSTPMARYTRSFAAPLEVWLLTRYPCWDYHPVLSLFR